MHIAKPIGAVDVGGLIRLGGCFLVVISTAAVGVIGCVSVWLARAAIITR
jgi:hypothetical protein